MYLEKITHFSRDPVNYGSDSYNLNSYLGHLEHRKTMTVTGGDLRTRATMTMESIQSESDEIDRSCHHLIGGEKDW